MVLQVGETSRPPKSDNVLGWGARSQMSERVGTGSDAVHLTLLRKMTRKPICSS